MKIKTLAIVMLVATLFGCKKAPQMREVVFHTNLIESGKLTRSADHSEILSLIESCYPTITPKLHYSDDEYVTLPLDTPVNVRVGYWLIDWYGPSITHMAEAMHYSYFALQPYMEICNWTNITATESDYSLPIRFCSSAFVYDIREVSKINYNSSNGNLPSTKIGFYKAATNYALFFVNWSKDEEDGILMLRVFPIDESGKVTTFYFSYTYDEWQGNPVHKLEYGHYYVLHPDAVTDVDATFSLAYPDWICDFD